MSPFRQVGRLVAVQVGRLRAALGRLAGAVRAAVARAVGQATGEAVREAPRIILDGLPARLGYHDPPDDWAWGQPRHPTWPAHRAYGPYARDLDERDPDENSDDEPVRSNVATDVGTPDDEPTASRRPGAWSRAIAVGCQAAAWWLRRHPGPGRWPQHRHRGGRGDAGQQPTGGRGIGCGGIGPRGAGPGRRRLRFRHPGRLGPEVTAAT
jgi:hypothetical protein